MKTFNKTPVKIIKTNSREIYIFDDLRGGNIDLNVVKSFGDEWKTFNDFNTETIKKMGREYFDIVDDKILNKNTYALDVGCGSGRFTKYLLPKIAFMEAIDPGNAIFAADKLLGDSTNVRLSMASTDNIPFEDETFDFVMSIGVLHHIPNTQKAMRDCIRKVKTGGYFFTYLYYNLDNRGKLFKFLFYIVTIFRKIISKCPQILKQIICNIIAVSIYMPIIIICRIFSIIGCKKLAGRLPLSYYHDKSFYVVRNDALDRFGTSLEQRFSRAEVESMMRESGCDDIVIADTPPYWHAIGKRIR